METTGKLLMSRFLVVSSRFPFLGNRFFHPVSYPSNLVLTQHLAGSPPSLIYKQKFSYLLSEIDTKPSFSFPKLNHILKVLLFFLLHLFLGVFSSVQSTWSCSWVFPELHLLETLHWPRIIAVVDGPYCERVGLSFNPFLIPLCWPNRFSTMSELMKPGLMPCPFPNLSLQRDINPEMVE